MAEPAATNAPVRPWWDLTAERTRLVALSLLVLITVPMMTKIFTSDFGTHIAKGRQVIRTMGIPSAEFLNYPRLGAPTDNAEWGFQALLYLVHSAGGEYAVSFLIWLVVFGVFYFLFRATVVRGAHPLLAILCIAAFSGFLRIRIQPRPEIFTYLYISVSLYLLSEYYYGERKRLIYGFPVLAVVWANTHPTYLMLFILFGVFFLDRLARAAWNRELRWALVKGWAWKPVAVGVAALILVGLNPYGYDALMAPIHLLTKGKTAAGGQTQMLTQISELTPVVGTGFYRYYKAAAVLTGISIALGLFGRGVYLLDLLLLILSFTAAYEAARAVSMMGLFLSPGISLQLTAFLRKVWKRAEGGHPAPERSGPAPPAKRRGKPGVSTEKRGGAIAGRTRGPLYLVTAAVVVPMVVFGIVILSFSFSQLEYGVGITEHKFSFKAGEFLRSEPIQGNMFNFFDIGGFLDWQLFPGKLTFIDGRTNSGNLFMDHQTVTGAMPGWEEIVRRYRITHMVLKGMDSSGMILPIVPVLANHPDWSLVFADGLFLVFVRNTPELAGYVRKHEIPKAVLPWHLIQEAFHYMYLGVSPVMAYQTMSNMYMLLGDRNAAIEVMRRALAEADEPFLRERLRQLEGTPGRIPFSGKR